jgi:hypothetical protein
MLGGLSQFASWDVASVHTPKVRPFAGQFIEGSNLNREYGLVSGSAAADAPAILDCPKAM